MWKERCVLNESKFVQVQQQKKNNSDKTSFSKQNAALWKVTLVKVAAWEAPFQFPAQLMWPLCFFSPEWVLDGDVAVYSDGHQAEDGALGEDEDEASDEQAAEEVGTEAGTDVGKRENITSGKKILKKHKNPLKTRIVSVIYNTFT